MSPRERIERDDNSAINLSVDMAPGETEENEWRCSSIEWNSEPCGYYVDFPLYSYVSIKMSPDTFAKLKLFLLGRRINLFSNSRTTIRLTKMIRVHLTPGVLQRIQLSAPYASSMPGVSKRLFVT